MVKEIRSDTFAAGKGLFLEEVTHFLHFPNELLTEPL